MRAHIIAKIHFYATDRGGRKVAIPPPHFGCPFEIDNRSYDCRVMIQKKQPVQPGVTNLFPVEFIRPDLVVPKLSIGQTFFLWEGRHIAEGEVIEIPVGTSSSKKGV